MEKLKKFYPFLLLLLIPVFANRVRPTPRAVVWSDAEGYFSYLPLVFTIGDVHKLPDGSVNGRKNAAGENVIKYTCGVAYFQLPGFFLAKMYMRATGKTNPDIFSREFCYAVWLTGYLLGVLGLFYLNRALQARGFSAGVAAVTVFTVFFGTNLFHYTSFEAGMSHVYSFFLFSVLLFLSPRFFEKPSLPTALLMGLFSAWVVLIRPTNLVFILFLLVVQYGGNWRSLVLFVRKNSGSLAAALFCGFLVFLPQLMYWKEMTGQWIRFSYEGETFKYWKDPKLLAVLFDSQNGLFMYSPTVFLMIIGMFLGWKNEKVGKGGGLSQFILFVLITYIFGSWWAWWFGGAFGHRSYVEYYAVFAFSLAFLLEKIALTTAWKRKVFGLLLAFLWFYSIKMSYLYKILPSPWDGPEWRWNMEKMYWIWQHLF